MSSPIEHQRHRRRERARRRLWEAETESFERAIEGTPLEDGLPPDSCTTLADRLGVGT